MSNSPQVWPRSRSPRSPDATPSDEELEGAFLRRTPDALAHVYRRHAPILRAVAARTLAAQADADDCVHDVLLRLWLAPDAYRRERGALRAFLIVCVRNEALARRRTAARRFDLDVRAARTAIAADERFEDRDVIEFARVREALRTLPDEQRAVIELAYFGDRSQTEIARELGIPLGTVKGRAALGLRKLTTALRRQNRG